MLTSLLPGFRQVRTPLITGSVYLLVLWLALGPKRLLPDAGAGIFEDRLASLADLVGTTVTLAAVAVIATLLGSLATIHTWPGGISPFVKEDDEYFPATQFAHATDWALLLLKGRAQYLPQRLLGDQSRLLPGSYVRAVRAYTLQHAVHVRNPGHRHTDWVEPSDLEHWWWECLAYPLAIYAMTVERHMLADKLEGAGNPLFQQYDRARSEAELRYSLVPPLVLLTVVVGALWTWWAVLVGIPTAVLLVVAGRHSEKASQRTLARALRTGVVSSDLAGTIVGLIEQEQRASTDSDSHPDFLTSETHDLWLPEEQEGAGGSAIALGDGDGDGTTLLVIADAPSKKDLNLVHEAMKDVAHRMRTLTF